MHLGPFGCLTKLDVKRGELVQKFLPRSRNGIFRNERIRSTPLDPKLMFSAIRTIWVHLEPFGCHTNRGAKRAELVQKFENEDASEFFATNTPDPPHWTLNLYFGVIHTIWVHLGPFGCHTNLGAKRAELVQKFENEVASEFFAPNTPIHPIGP